MDDPETFLAKAEEAGKAAAETQSPVTRRILRTLAEEYRLVAAETLKVAGKAPKTSS
jgi:hypothetical protein